MQAIILAGGLGTRLRAVIADIPKAMALVTGRPFLEYLMESLSRQGVYQVTLAVGYLHDMIISHFGNAWHDLTISYSIEAKPLGTGGAIKQAMLGMPDAPTVVMNGDTFIDLDLELMLEAHDQADADITIATRLVSDVTRYGSIVTKADRITGFYEKGVTGPGLINAGAYIFRPSLFNKLKAPAVFSFEQDILVRYVRNLKLSAFKTNGFFIDIGIPEDYQRAARLLGQTGQIDE